MANNKLSIIENVNTADCQFIIIEKIIKNKCPDENLILGCSYTDKKLDFQLYLSKKVKECDKSVRYLCVQNYTEGEWFLSLKNNSNTWKKILIPAKMRCNEVHRVDFNEDGDEICIGAVFTKVESENQNSQHRDLSQSNDPYDRKLRDLSEMVLTLYDKSLYSDMEICSNDGHTRKAHKAVLAASSAVWDAMFSHGTVEATSGQVTISELDSNGLNCFLRYVYTRDTEHITPELCEQMMVMADKYQLEYLKETVESKMCELVSIENVVGMYHVADLYRLKSLQLKVGEILRSVDFLKSPYYAQLDNPNILKCIISYTELIQQCEQVTATFTLNAIQNFKNSVCSPRFYWGGMGWCLNIKVKSEGSTKYLSVFLNSYADDKVNWSCTALVSIKIVSYTFKDLTRSFTQNFTKKNGGFGWENFIQFSQILNPCFGFVKDNTVTFQVNISNKPDSRQIDGPHSSDQNSLGQ